MSLIAPTPALRWAPDRRAVLIVDQRALPGAFVEWPLRTIDDGVEAIATLALRGAPAIGVGAAMVLALAAHAHAAESPDAWRRWVRAAAARLAATRPTAVNLRWAMDRMCNALDAHATDDARDRLLAEAERIRAEDAACCDAIAAHGSALLPDGARVLTHCNAGALATAGIGTALAPIYHAHAAGRAPQVWADETRPLLQGARLTAWELQRAGIPVTVCTDGMTASLMAAGMIDCVIVGADRIAANGDVANKIGTYGLAIIARHHGVPFYVAAPRSTIDATLPDGSAIPIEARHADEVHVIGGVRMTPADVAAYTPAFDVTPAALITAIVTDAEVVTHPYNWGRTGKTGTTGTTGGYGEGGTRDRSGDHR